MPRSLFTVALVAVLAGCSGLRPVVRKSGPSADPETESWRETILRKGQDGDWLVIRGYNSSDHLVAVMANSELSHVGILNAEKGEVIEAVSPVVRSVSLQAFLEGADRVLLVRPANAGAASGRLGLRRPGRESALRTISWERWDFRTNTGSTVRSWPPGRRGGGRS